MSRILVTGGAGFIGTHICERLLDHEVVCLDNFNDYYNPKIKEDNVSHLKKDENFTLVRGDILDVRTLESIFSNKIKKIIHLAAIAGVRPSLVTPEKYIEIDVKGTLNLLEMARKHGVEQFIFASSSSVYGINALPFSEEDRTDLQTSPYAAAKRSAELYCATYHYLYGIPTTILRFFTVYGPRQRPDMAIHTFTRLMVSGKPVPIFGDGQSKRDYTFIDDAVQGVIHSLEREYPFEIFNIGNSTTITIREVVETIGENLNLQPLIEYLPEQKGDVPATCADITKARKMLGYNPSTPIGKGIETFVRWYMLKRDILEGKS